ncbi:MAG: suppressor of fused domain protein [Rubripirellula sp.]
MLVRLVSKGKIEPNTGISSDGESWLKAKKIVGLPFPEAAPKLWFVQTKSGTAGPFTVAKLRKLAKQGRVKPNVAVSCDQEVWIKAQQVPGVRFPSVATKQPAAAPENLQQDEPAATDSIAAIQRSHDSDPPPAIASHDSVAVEQEHSKESVSPHYKVALLGPVPLPLDQSETNDQLEANDQLATNDQLEAEKQTRQYRVKRLGRMPVATTASLAEVGKSETIQVCVYKIASLGRIPTASKQIQSEVEPNQPEATVTQALPPEEAESTPSTARYKIASLGRIPPADDSETVTEQPPQLDSDPDPTTTEVSPEAAAWSQQRETAYVHHFGPFSEVRRAKTGNAIDVYVHPPNEHRPVTTLVTSGMSDHAMQVPPGPNSPRTELIMYVDQMHDAYVNLLQFLAETPRRQDSWLSYGALMNNGNPARPIFQGSDLDSYVFMIPNVQSDFMIRQTLQLDGDPVQLLWVVPITRAERAVIKNLGMRHFCWLMDQNQHSLVVEPHRSCYANLPTRAPSTLSPVVSQLH